MEKIQDRFIRYVKIDTQADPHSNTTPSAAKMFNLANLLKDELIQLGLKDVHLDAKCYLRATLPANTSGKDLPTVGFIAHVDTAPECSGKNVKPQTVSNYTGGDVRLNADTVISESVFPNLKKYVGQSLITTSGDTLLGADDKAGVAAIMDAIAYLQAHPEVPHGTIKIGFTPDEEIGKGADHFDVEAFGADFAYTIDGGEVGELEYENFNAAGATVEIQGVEVHPGYAKDKMVNAVSIATEIEQALPYHKPSNTIDREGFFHLFELTGTTREAKMTYIIRDHDMEKFLEKKKLLESIVESKKLQYPLAQISLSIKDQYYNMLEKVAPHMHIVEVAQKAMENIGITPIVKPIRGGTDGARLSYMGLPCPNIFAGGENFHSRFEYIPIPSLEKASQTIVEIAKLLAE